MRSVRSDVCVNGQQEVDFETGIRTDFFRSLIQHDV